MKTTEQGFQTVTLQKTVKKASEKSERDSGVQHKIKETTLTFFLNGNYSDPKSTKAQC